jgi:hypothetical protein
MRELPIFRRRTVGSEQEAAVHHFAVIELRL